MNLGKTILVAFLLMPTSGQSQENQNLNDFVQGTWLTQLIREEQFFYFKTKMVIEDDKFLRDMTLMIDHPLFEGAYHINFEGTYSIGSAITGQEDTFEVNWVINKIVETPMSKSAADSSNDDVHCGFNDWQVGVAKDITGIDCEGDLIAAGDVTYDIMKVDISNETLQFGDIPDGDLVTGTTPDNRPTGLSSTDYLSRDGSTGSAPDPIDDPLRGIYAIEEVMASQNGCTSPLAPTTTEFSYLEFFPLADLFTSATGWITQTCTSIEDCLEQPNELNFFGDWNVGDRVPNGYEGEFNYTSGFGNVCNVELVESRSTLTEAGEIEINQTTFTGTFSVTERSECDASSDAYQAWLPQRECQVKRLLRATKVQ